MRLSWRCPRRTWIEGPHRVHPMSDNSQRPCDQARYCAPSLHSEPMSDQPESFHSPRGPSCGGLPSRPPPDRVHLPPYPGVAAPAADFMGHVHNADDPNVHLA